ncbi:MAG: family N-acetyltransferase [Caulobacter sp.]|nr:family N-acetyltransferase [Caulobacter sp.]
MPASTLSLRSATSADIPALSAVMDAAIGELQRGFLTPEQIAASRKVMGLDRQLIEDGTYFVVQDGVGQVAGCGGWSRRRTLHGHDHTPGRDDAPLDPAHDGARVRAMYTAPAFARRGVGRMILAACERAAAGEGFRRMELSGTMAGQPLYEACGYRVTERSEETADGVSFPLARMGKPLTGLVTVSPAGEADRVLIEGLMQFYIYDFSEMEPAGSADFEVEADGQFAPYPYLPDYWRDADRHALVIRVGGAPAGFALVNGHSHHGGRVERNMGEFFVMRKHRGRGAAAEAVRQVLALLPGQWEVAVARRNTRALSFWPRAIEAAGVSGLAVAEGDGEHWTGPIWTFRAP